MVLTSGMSYTQGKKGVRSTTVPLEQNLLNSVSLEKVKAEDQLLK